MNRATERVVRKAIESMQDRGSLLETMDVDAYIEQVKREGYNELLDEIVLIAAEEGYENGLYDHLEGKR